MSIFFGNIDLEVIMKYRYVAVLALFAVLTGFAQWSADPRYHRVDEVVDVTVALADTYSAFCHIETLAVSPWFAKPILAMRISNNPSVDEDETTLMFVGGQHADEPQGVESCIWMMRDLLHRIDAGDSAATLWWETYEIWIVPQMNVDGRVMCLDSNYSEWRKTCHDLDSNGVLDAYTDGVDPNRNWDYEWDDYEPTDYDNTKGTEPWTEVCVVAMRDFFIRERPLFLVDLHSPDYIGGNKLWTCWFFEDGPWDATYTPEGSEAYDEVRYFLSQRIKDENGDSYEGLWANQNKPKLQNWYYYTLGDCPIILEITNQCFWHADTIDTIATRVGRGLYYLMERPLERLLTVYVVDTLGEPVLDAGVDVVELQHEYIPMRTVDPVFGAARKLLRGNKYYTLEITAPGMPTEIHDSVYIPNGPPVNKTIIMGDASIGEVELPNRAVLRASPNPFNSAVRIEYSPDISGELEIFDVDGKLIYRADLNTTGTTIWEPEGNISSGLYFARLAGTQSPSVKLIYLK